MERFIFHTEDAASCVYDAIVHYMTTHHYITLGQVCTLAGRSYTPEESQVGWRSTNGIKIVYNAYQNVYKLVLPVPEPLATGCVVEMTMNNYQTLAARTINDELNAREKYHHALHGMVGEIGELHSLYQKTYQGHEIDREHAKKELGDLLWFIAEYCTANGWDLGEIAQMNIDKLKARYPEGFEVERSLNRAEGDV